LAEKPIEKTQSVTVISLKNSVTKYGSTDSSHQIINAAMLVEISKIGKVQSVSVCGRVYLSVCVCVCVCVWVG